MFKILLKMCKIKIIDLNNTKCNHFVISNYVIMVAFKGNKLYIYYRLKFFIYTFVSIIPMLALIMFVSIPRFWA